MACTIFYRSNTEVAGSKPVRIDICLRFSGLRCPVCLDVLRWADPPSKEPY
jgi:hypothetical protein